MEHFIKETCCNSSKDGFDTDQQKPFVISPPVRTQPRAMTSRGQTGCALESQRTLHIQDGHQKYEGKTETKYHARKIHSEPLSSLLLTKSLNYRLNSYRDNPKIPLIKCRSNLDWGKTTVISKGNVKLDKGSHAMHEFSQTKPFSLCPDASLTLNSSRNGAGIEMQPLAQSSDQFIPWRECHEETAGKDINSILERDICNLTRSKLKPLGFRPALLLADLQGDFGTELSIHGSVFRLSKRVKSQNGLEELEDSAGNVLLKRENLRNENARNYTEVQWADGFAKSTVRRLNQVALSLSEPRTASGGKLRSRRMECSTCCYNV